MFPDMNRASARVFLDHEFCTVLVPYILRAGGFGFMWWLLRKLCGGDIRQVALTAEADDLETPRAHRVALPSGLHVWIQSGLIPASYYFTSTWQEMRQRLNFRPRRLACATSAIRLILWHYLQAFMSGLIFWAYSDLMDGVQFGFGFVFLYRDVSYLVVATYTAWKHPAFLLFAPGRATWGEFFMYVICPEKLLLMGVSGAFLPGRSKIGVVVFVVLYRASRLADLCGATAFIYGLAHHQMWPVLAVTYSVPVASLAYSVTCLAVTFLTAIDRCFVAGTCRNNLQTSA